MIVCDRCIKNLGTNLLVMHGEHSAYSKWQLCGDCFDHVIGEATKSVENYMPGPLREFCPSLTPDQVKQVELYVQSRNKK